MKDGARKMVYDMEFYLEWSDIKNISQQLVIPFLGSNINSPIISVTIFILCIWRCGIWYVNVRTRDGLNTFHTMEGTQCIIPQWSEQTQTKVEIMASENWRSDKNKILYKRAMPLVLKILSVCGYQVLLSDQLNYKPG